MRTLKGAELSALLFGSIAGLVGMLRPELLAHIGCGHCDQCRGGLGFGLAIASGSPLQLADAIPGFREHSQTAFRSASVDQILPREDALRFQDRFDTHGLKTGADLELVHGGEFADRFQLRDSEREAIGTCLRRVGLTEHQPGANNDSTLVMYVALTRVRPDDYNEPSDLFAQLMRIAGSRGVILRDWQAVFTNLQLPFQDTKTSIGRMKFVGDLAALESVIREICANNARHLANAPVLSVLGSNGEAGDHFFVQAYERVGPKTFGELIQFSRRDLRERGLVPDYINYIESNLGRLGLCLASSI